MTDDTLIAIARIVASKGDPDDILTYDALLRLIARLADRNDELESALADATKPAPEQEFVILPASHWIGLFPDRFLSADRIASGGQEDYDEWPLRAAGVYFAGYPIRACTLIWQAGGGEGWGNRAITMAVQGFDTISQKTIRPPSDALAEGLFLRGVSTLIGHLPNSVARNTLIQRAGEVWSWWWALNQVKRKIDHIVTDWLEFAYVMIRYDLDGARLAQYHELIDWAAPLMEARYAAATAQGWIMALDDDPKYQVPADVAHAGRTARFIAVMVQLGETRWARWLPLMVETFKRVYNPATARFSGQLDGTSTPEAQNFGYLWAALTAVDEDVHRALEGYAHDPYMALTLAELAAAAKKRESA